MQLMLLGQKSDPLHLVKSTVEGIVLSIAIQRFIFQIIAVLASYPLIFCQKVFKMLLLKIRAGHATVYCHDNVTMFSDHTLVGYCIMSIFDV